MFIVCTKNFAISGGNQIEHRNFRKKKKTRKQQALFYRLEGSVHFSSFQSYIIRNNRKSNFGLFRLAIPLPILNGQPKCVFFSAMVNTQGSSFSTCRKNTAPSVKSQSAGYKDDFFQEWPWKAPGGILSVGPWKGHGEILGRPQGSRGSLGFMAGSWRRRSYKAV